MNERFKEIRLANKMSQEEYGKRIGIESRAHISSLENGNRNITDRIISDVCREFNVNEEWLRTGIGEMFIQRTRTEKITDFAADVLKDEEESFRRRLVEALADLEVDEWELLEKIAEKAMKKRKARETLA